MRGILKDMGGRFGRMMLAGLLLAASTPAAAAPVPAAAAAAPGEPRPALWLLADDDTRIYLFGTVHVLHPSLRWRSAALNRVVREAQELVLEVADEEMANAGSEIFDTMPLVEPLPLLQRVTPDRRAALSRLLAEQQIAEGSLDGLETWAVAAILGVGQMAREYSGAGETDPTVAPPGVEEALSVEFRADGRPITGVETAADQIDAFRGMPAAVQQAMLDGIAAEMETLPPELYEALVTRRNRHFADWLAARLDRPGTVLFAVGAGHLAGRVSVQSMLESRGLRVTRLN